jgi:hypothetical protein
MALAVRHPETVGQPTQSKVRDTLCSSVRVPCLWLRKRRAAQQSRNAGSQIHPACRIVLTGRAPLILRHLRKSEILRKARVVNDVLLAVRKLIFRDHTLYLV